MGPWPAAVALALSIALASGCSGRRGAADGGARLDSGRSDGSAGVDATPGDGGGVDGSSSGDAAAGDAGPGRDGAAGGDAGSGPDGGPGRSDAGFDAGFDAGPPRVDAGPPTAACMSGATGTHVARFRWIGTTSGSTASVRYEANTLPDTSRWRVTANSRSIGYRPVFRDPFLGIGGLDLSGTVFIDVELSTRSLRPVRRATLSIFGRSFNTTASGSYSWMSFSGSGASPRGGVSNVAPYRWYSADATAALPAGDGSTLLRIQAGPPSNSLIVSRGEICFDAP